MEQLTNDPNDADRRVVLKAMVGRIIEPKTGMLIGAISDLQAQMVKTLVEGAGQKFDYVNLPTAAHAMHQADPQRFVSVLQPWAAKLPA